MKMKVNKYLPLKTLVNVIKMVITESKAFKRAIKGLVVTVWKSNKQNLTVYKK